MAYRRFKIPVSAAPLATLAKVATLSPELSQTSQVSQGTYPENAICEARTVASVATVARTPSETTSFEPTGPSYENWTDEDWQVAFDERAAILEFDGGWHRDSAEALARQYIDEQKALRKERA